jgi:hypothetical protein
LANSLQDGNQTSKYSEFRGVDNRSHRDQKFRGKVEVAKKGPLERRQPQEHVEEINNTAKRESNIQSEWLQILPQSIKSAKNTLQGPGIT